MAAKMIFGYVLMPLVLSALDWQASAAGGLASSGV
jgi:hypothetical protein